MGSVGLALSGWVTGTAVIWSSLFAVGNFLYGRLTYGVILSWVFVLSGLGLVAVINRLWTTDKRAGRNIVTEAGS